MREAQGARVEAIVPGPFSSRLLLPVPISKCTCDSVAPPERPLQAKKSRHLPAIVRVANEEILQH